MVIESKRKAVSLVCGLNALCLKANTSIIPALLSADDVHAAAATTTAAAVSSSFSFSPFSSSCTSSSCASSYSRLCLRALVALILVH
jgi:hypothetical protein